MNTLRNNSIIRVWLRGERGMKVLSKLRKRFYKFMQPHPTSSQMKVMQEGSSIRTWRRRRVRYHLTLAKQYYRIFSSHNTISTANNHSLACNLKPCEVFGHRLLLMHALLPVLTVISFFLFFFILTVVTFCQFPLGSHLFLPWNSPCKAGLISPPGSSAWLQAKLIGYLLSDRLSIILAANTGFPALSSMTNSQMAA